MSDELSKKGSSLASLEFRISAGNNAWEINDAVSTLSSLETDDSLSNQERKERMGNIVKRLFPIIPEAITVITFGGIDFAKTEKDEKSIVWDKKDLTAFANNLQKSVPQRKTSW